MTKQVKLRTGEPFHGVIHARDSRDNACLTWVISIIFFIIIITNNTFRYGTGRTTTFLTVNLLTPVKHKAFCGVSYNNVSIFKLLTIIKHKSCWVTYIYVVNFVSSLFMGRMVKIREYGSRNQNVFTPQWCHQVSLPFPHSHTLALRHESYQCNEIFTWTVSLLTKIERLQIM